MKLLSLCLVAMLAVTGCGLFQQPTKVDNSTSEQTTEARKKRMEALMLKYPKDFKWALRRIVSRAGDNQDAVISLLENLEKERQDTAITILFQIDAEQLRNMKSKKLAGEIDKLGNALANVPKNLKFQLTGILLNKTGDNQPEILKTLTNVKDEHTTGAAFLIAHMPEHDLQSLSSEFLLQEVELAYKSWQSSPWHEDIPEQLFLQYILPYSNFNERRDSWRGDFTERLREKAWSFKNPMDAIIWLNSDLNDEFKVYFHKSKRPKPDQSPYESIEAGYASCTGLSILLTDACRAIGVPARIVGIPRWTEVRGNHNWVEVWDEQWHNVGGTGSDPRNDDWVNERTRNQSDPDNWMNMVYATCYRKTSLKFPLIWDMDIDYIPALNVTRFYSLGEEVEIAIPGGGEGTVVVYWAGEIIGRRKGKDKVKFNLARGTNYKIEITTSGGKTHQQALKL